MLPFIRSHPILGQAVLALDTAHSLIGPRDQRGLLAQQAATQTNQQTDKQITNPAATNAKPSPRGVHGGRRRAAGRHLGFRAHAGAARLLLPPRAAGVHLRPPLPAHPGPIRAHLQLPAGALFACGASTSASGPSRPAPGAQPRLRRHRRAGPRLPSGEQVPRPGEAPRRRKPRAACAHPRASGAAARGASRHQVCSSAVPEIDGMHQLLGAALTPSTYYSWVLAISPTTSSPPTPATTGPTYYEVRLVATYMHMTTIMPF